MKMSAWWFLWPCLSSQLKQLRAVCPATWRQHVGRGSQISTSLCQLACSQTTCQKYPKMDRHESGLSLLRFHLKETSNNSHSQLKKRCHQTYLKLVSFLPITFPPRRRGISQTPTPTPLTSKSTHGTSTISAAGDLVDSSPDDFPFSKQINLK